MDGQIPYKHSQNKEGKIIYDFRPKQAHTNNISIRPYMSQYIKHKSKQDHPTKVKGDSHMNASL